MKRETVKSFFGKTLIFQILFFVAALFLTIYFFPREEKFRYHFQEGKPWKYGLLTASFDFPIYKSQTKKLVCYIQTSFSIWLTLILLFLP